MYVHVADRKGTNFEIEQKRKCSNAARLRSSVWRRSAHDGAQIARERKAAAAAAAALHLAEVVRPGRAETAGGHGVRGGRAG